MVKTVSGSPARWCTPTRLCFGCRPHATPGDRLASGGRLRQAFELAGAWHISFGNTPTALGVAGIGPALRGGGASPRRCIRSNIFLGISFSFFCRFQENKVGTRGRGKLLLPFRLNPTLLGCFGFPSCLTLYTIMYLENKKID